jgi:hypothetical protein
MNRTIRSRGLCRRAGPTLIAGLLCLPIVSSSHPAFAQEATPQASPAPQTSVPEAAAASQPAADPAAASQAPAVSQEDLVRRIQALEEANEQRELESLRSDAEAAASESAGETAAPTTFTSGSRSLQALNPEMSITADAGAHLGLSGTDWNGMSERSGMDFRSLGLHLQANLDPYSFVKVAIPLTPEGIELEEAYATWVAVLPGLSISLGRFRQDLGTVNRWHEEALDQVDYPLALTTLFGEEGLNQIGISVDQRLPSLFADSQAITVQLTNPMNEQLFTGRMTGIPAALARLRNYWDLSESTYFELGLSGMWGTNNATGETWRDTWVGGLDLNFAWAPAQQLRYRGLAWRSEIYLVEKELPRARLQAIGGYSYLDLRLSDSWVIGLRGDLTQPFELDNKGRWDWGFSPYVTWSQSEWVKLRLQGTHLRHAGGEDETVLMLQAVMAAGPHKHDKY